MAGDWIRMRVLLPRDPKVIAIADHLAWERPFLCWLTDPVRRHCKESAYEHVTPDVLVMITVTSLLITWGITRDRGNIDGDDLILRHCTLDAIDVMCGVPRFGAAMASVGWVIEEECGDGSTRLRFPNFLLDNAPSEDAKKQAHREAQRRHRAKKKAEAEAAGVIRGDITTASRGDTEKRREEERREDGKTPLTPQGGEGWAEEKPKKPARRKAEPKPLEIPAAIDTPAFRAALDRWLAYKRERGQTYKAIGLQGFVSARAAEGHDAAIRNIDYSIAQNYQGCFAPKDAPAPAARQQTIDDMLKGLTFPDSPKEGTP